MSLRIPARVRRNALKRCEQIADEVIEQIRQSPKTPHLTGELANSYYWRHSADGKGVVIDSHTDYWRYVEFGTHRHGDAQPHVRPAIEAILLKHLNKGGRRAA
jgi:HK97 gp10 family phage protein